MNDLEEAGLLEQPHTSAGRVPTDLGYRVYVDELMSPVKMSPGERAVIRKALFGGGKGQIRDAATILDQTVRALSGITHLLAVSLEPRLEKGFFEKIELLDLGGQKILAVLTIAKGYVRTLVLEIEAQVEGESLHKTAALINERLSGLPMRVIRESVRERMRDVSTGDPTVLKLILNNSQELFAPPSEEGDIHFSGTPHILALPEFADKERIVSLMCALEEKDIFLRILRRKTSEDGLTITIGEENQEGEMQFCSLVASPYKMGESQGSIGILGPTRMEYSKLVTIVDYTARIMSDVLASIFHKPDQLGKKSSPRKAKSQ
jgi:heat-inducible transcriptional repressor